MPLTPPRLSADRRTARRRATGRRSPVTRLLTWLTSAGSTRRRLEPVGAFADGVVELEVVLAVVTDLRTRTDASGTWRADFLLEGHLPATQLSPRGVTTVALEALRICDLAVTPEVAAQLDRWGASETAVTGQVHFDREAVDRYRGRGPLRTLALADEHGQEIVLRRG